jgi:hypothetical protein
MILWEHDNEKLIPKRNDTPGRRQVWAGKPPAARRYPVKGVDPGIEGSQLPVYYCITALCNPV